MIRMPVLVVFALVLALAAPVRGGIVITFTPGSKDGGRPVLPHIPLKAVIAELLDPGNTGLGKSLGYLLWREILTAISDQAGAGVILAIPPAGQRLVDLLEQDYHLAAVQIAQQQRARMVVWGAVLTQGQQLYVHSYLTLLPELGRTELMVRLSTNPKETVALEAEIPRTRFNFALVETSREQLFARRLVVRQATTLRAGPDETTTVVARIPAGAVLEAHDMEEGWFKVRTPSGASAYIENSKVDIPPRQVEATARNIRLRSGPGSDSGVLRTVNLNGTYGVFDMRYRSGSGLWYQLDVNGTKGWVPAVAVRPRFSLPVVHFLAGLYRYQAKRYEDAAREFAQFINVPEVKADNVNLATALQLWGASEMLSKKTAFEVDRKVLERFDESIKQTPYDPAAYNLRALATIGVRQEVTPALRDLERALELDGHNERARALVRALTQIANPRTFSPFQEALEDLEEARQDLHRLRSRFAISVP